MSNTCATCRWYTPMPHEGSDHGDCEMGDGDDRDVLGDDTCEDWTARVDTPTHNCSTCRWYLRDGYPDRRYGACKRLSWEQYRVAATHTCGDWEASTPTPGVGCGVGEPQGRPWTDADRRTQARSDWTNAMSKIRHGEALASWRLLRLAHQAAADAAGVLEGLEGKGGES